MIHGNAKERDMLGATHSSHELKGTMSWGGKTRPVLSPDCTTKAVVIIESFLSVSVGRNQWLPF